MARKSKVELNIIAQIKELEQKIQLQIDRAEKARETLGSAEAAIEIMDGARRQLQGLLEMGKEKKVSVTSPAPGPERAPRRSAAGPDPYSP